MAQRTLLALAAALAACYEPVVPVGVPCAMNGDCPGGQSCNEDTRTCESTDGLIWRDDTADDFGAAGAVADGAAVEAAGAVAPVAYFVGGLRLSGIDDNVIPDPATTWNEIASRPRTGTTFVRSAELGLGTGIPLGLGLTKPNDITVIVEGEVYLDETGTWEFQLYADEIGFLELAPPGSSVFQRVATSERADDEKPYEVAAPGWHRLRGAFADLSGSMEYMLRYDDPGPGNFQTIDPLDLRAPANNVRGLNVDGFNQPFLLGPGGSVVHPGTLANPMLDTNPFGLPIGGSSDYALRFAGQVLIEVDGSYAFRIDTGQGHRMWLDGTIVADKLGTVPEVSTTPLVQLDPGWHDFVIDMHKTGTMAARLDVTVAEGPVWAGQAIPAANFRPVVGRATRWTAEALGGSTAIPDQGTTPRTLSLDLPPRMMTSRIDVAFQFSHPNQGTMQIQVDPPTGTTQTPVQPGTLMGSGSYYQHITMPPSTAGVTWNILATDTALDMVTGSLTFAAVTMLGSADPAPFPASYSYTSAPRDLETVASFTSVKWALRQDRPDAKVTVSFRSCDSEAACADQPWTAVARGARPGVPPGRFAQYKIELSGGGDVPTALDWIEIRYLPQ